MKDFISILNQTTGNMPNQGENNDSDTVDFSMEERFVIGHVVNKAISNDVIDIDFLTSDHFQNGFYGCLYEYCLSSKQDGDIVTLANIEHDLLKSDKDAGEFMKYLICEAIKAPASMVKNFAYSIDEYYKYQQIKSESEALQESIREYTKFSDIKKIFDIFNEKISKLTYSPTASKTVFTHDESIDDFEESFFSPDSQRILTGLKPLDDIIGGFGRGELIVNGGRPGMGKTAFAIHLQGEIASRGLNCLSFNFEMSNNQNASRFISRDTYIENNHSSVAYNKFMKKEGDLYDFKRAFEIAKANKKNITHNYGNLSTDEIISFATQHAHGLVRENKQIDLIVVDYLQIIRMQNKRDAHLEIGEITGKLKQLAKSLNCPVMLLSQLNRSIEGNSDKRPSLQHLRQSGKIEEDADIVLFPYRPCYYEREADEMQREWNEDYVEIIVEKNRVGNKGTAKIKANMAVNYFESGIFDQVDSKSGMTEYGISEYTKNKERKNNRIKRPEDF